MVETFQSKIEGEKNNSLKLDKKTVMGALGIVGNILYTIYGTRRYLDGVKSGDSKEVSSGKKIVFESAASLGGHLVLGAFGTYPPEKQFDILEKRMLHHIGSQGGVLSVDGKDKADEYSMRGTAQKLLEYVKTHPAEVAYMWNAALSPLTIYGGVEKIESGVQKVTAGESIESYTKGLKDQKSGYQELESGLLIGVGCIASALIEEKTKEQTDRADTHPILAKIQNRPTLISSGLSFFSNVKYTFRGYKELTEGMAKEGKSDYTGALKMLYGAIFLTNNIVMGSASKQVSGTTDQLDELRGRLLERARRVIAIQPPEMRDLVVKDIAEFLAVQKELRLENKTSADIVDSIMTDLPNQKDAIAFFKEEQKQLATSHSR